MLALALGCAEEVPRPQLWKVMPRRIYTDRPQRLTLSGRELLPRYHFELSEGRRSSDAGAFSGSVGDLHTSAQLRDFAVVGPDKLTATLDPGLPMGAFQMALTDGRGASAILDRAIEALGPDLDAPRVSVVAPRLGEAVAPGTPVSGRITAEDETVASLSWRASAAHGTVAEGQCVPVDPASSDSTASVLVAPTPPDDREGPAQTVITCDFRFVVPLDLPPGEALDLRVSAVDGSPRANLTALTSSFVLRSRPAITHVDPPRGSADGGTDVVIRGSGLPLGSQVLFGDRLLLPGGGTRVDEGTIVGTVPPGAPGPVTIRIVSSLGDVSHAQLFDYLAPPLPLLFEPAAGPATGGSLVRVRGRNFTPETRVLVGTQLATAVALVDPIFIDPTEIRGKMPPGEGTTSAFTVDAEAGIGHLPAAYAWKSVP
jgi:hypothetical protein